ncbi:Rare lipoprotein A RlpA [Helicobacter sp. NHP19-012]|uniref:Probable endolytic peptidoglycan transglycosylase RlpA n=1 Tax=Helicobacter gastrofelis TaxID=2849642 RepID=A0ABN6I668_9HELI|nr:MULTISPECIES: septal ring lytic transglycosylase RlpA family protein [unclassified Helicobacter]BCZ19076.1 Rare lipoprotein A RlpA [Helicobacter sp. NHP19-012]GMB96574.1 Rare lipoprotein A RlpA [Helicobacter sp. NHP22-001]
MKLCCQVVLVSLAFIGCAKNVEGQQSYAFSNKHESLRAYEDARDFNGTIPPRKHFSFFHRHKNKHLENKSYDTPVSKSSLTAGMIDSAAMQRATMRPYRVGGKTYYPTQVKVGQTFDGYASWYGPNFHAKKTSSGEIYNMYAHTAANKILPMNTIVKVTNKDNNRSTIVRINDRGPFVRNRIIDLSNAAARDVAMIGKGVAPVRLEVIGFGGVVAKQYAPSLEQNKQARALQKEFKVGESQKSYSGGNFSLQVGAFYNQQGAMHARDSLQVHLKNTNYSSVIVNGIKNDRPIYRVFIRGFKSQEEANDYAQYLKKSSILVRE